MKKLMYMKLTVVWFLWFILLNFFTPHTEIYFCLFSDCLSKFLCVLYIVFITIKKLINNKQIDNFVLIRRISCDFSLGNYCFPFVNVKCILVSVL